MLTADKTVTRLLRHLISTSTFDNVDSDTHLVHPHLPQGQAHPLLHVRPLLILLLQHVAGQEGGGGHGVVLLKRG